MGSRYLLCDDHDSKEETAPFRGPACGATSLNVGRPSGGAQAAGNLAVQRRLRSDSSDTLIQRQPVNPEAPVPAEETDEAAIWDLLQRGASGGMTGGARIPGFFISPPVRGPLDPFLPLSTRMKSGLGPLGPLSGGMYGAERYVGPNILKELKPRITMEGHYLQQLEAWQRLSSGVGGTYGMTQGQIKAADWPKLFGLGSSELESIPALVRRMNTEGWGALKPFEQELVRSFFSAHGEAGMTFGSPAISGTTRSGLSEMPHFGALQERPYVVRVKVPASEVGEVNAVLGTARPQHLVEEMEVLVFTDAGGKITNIRPNPVHGLGRAAPYLRGAGWVGLGVGLGYSAYRIAHAPPDERGRVIIEEVSGHAGGFAGGAVAAKVCAPLLAGGPIGIAGFIACGLVGAFLGSVAGSALGSFLAAGSDIMAMSMTGDIFPYLLSLGSQDPTACMDDPMAPECPDREEYLRKQREASLRGGLPPASEWHPELVPGPVGPHREPSLPELVTGQHWLSEKDRMLFIVRYLRNAQKDPALHKQFEIGMGIYWEDLWNAGYLTEEGLKPG